MNKKDNIDLKYITLKNIPGFFINERIRKILEVLDIITLEDFFNALEDKEFIRIFLSSPAMLKEFSATIKLLRCKYLGENPNIVINDNSSIEEVIDRLGLSLETSYELIRMKRIYNFLGILSKKSLGQKQVFLRRTTNLNEKGIEEFSYKLQIINDYIEEEKRKKVERQKKEKRESENEEIELEKLENLRAMINLLPRTRGK